MPRYLLYNFCFAKPSIVLIEENTNITRSKKHILQSSGNYQSTHQRNPHSNDTSQVNTRGFFHPRLSISCLLAARQLRFSVTDSQLIILSKAVVYRCLLWPKLKGFLTFVVDKPCSIKKYSNNRPRFYLLGL